MYLRKFSLKNVKCFGDAEMELAIPGSSGGAWNVILGGNATGKTTLLQAMAAVLVGPAAAQQLLKPAGWVRHGQDKGEFAAEFLRCEDDSAEGAPRKKPYAPRLFVTGNREVTLEKRPYAAPTLVLEEKDLKGLAKGPYAVNKPGWLTCGYGAFRRLSGGAEDAEFNYASGREARIASLFRESMALPRGLSLLPQLYARSVDPAQPEAARKSGEEALSRVKQLLNQLLPEPVQVTEVDTRTVYFRGPGAPRVETPELSDGYRSFLALLLDLLRRLDEAHGLAGVLAERDGRIEATSTGVVLVDEIDLHLHPLWQRTIGTRLRQVFPRLQFIVTSHSPFIAQDASPDSLFVARADRDDAPVTLFRPRYQVGGWRVEQILLSPLFGLSETRAPGVEATLKRHAELSARRTWASLTPAEQAELVRIESELAERLTSPGEDLPSLQREKAMNAFVDETLKRLGRGDDPA